MSSDFTRYVGNMEGATNHWGHERAEQMHGMQGSWTSLYEPMGGKKGSGQNRVWTTWREKLTKDTPGIGGRL